MDDRSQKLFAALFTTNVAERAAAADRLVSHFTAAGIHPADILLAKTSEFQGRLYEHQRSLQAKVEELHRDLEFLRARADREVVKLLDRSRVKVDKWPQFRELASKRLFRGGWPEQRGLDQRIAAVVEFSPDDIRRWREGVEEVPDIAFRRLEAATPDMARKRKVRKLRPRQLSQVGEVTIPRMEFEVLREIVSAHPSGLNAEKISASTGISKKTITARLSYLHSQALISRGRQGGYWVATPKAIEGFSEATAKPSAAMEQA